MATALQGTLYEEIPVAIHTTEEGQHPIQEEALLPIKEVTLLKEALLLTKDLTPPIGEVIAVVVLTTVPTLPTEEATVALVTDPTTVEVLLEVLLEAVDDQQEDQEDVDNN